MFCHVLLGLLRDGTPRHGYDLVTEYRARSGNHVNPGNVYRELVRLTKADFVQTSVNPPDADPRRIPYQITQRGCHEFDRWLVAPATQDEELSGWLIFLDRLEPEMRDEFRSIVYGYMRGT